MNNPAELTHVTRGDLVESKHFGSIIVLNPEGETLLSVGSPQDKVFTRSALKPLQLLAMHNLGLELATDQERAVALASHYGSHAHAEIVWNILSAGSLKTEQLLCPASWPFNAREARKHAARGGQARSILHACSGKHAAMLRTCQVNGWSLADYTAADHPLQVAIKEFVQRYTGETPYSTIDGCGAPTHAVSLVGLASAIRRMATSSANSPFALQRMAQNILRSARENGWIVSGAGSGDTILIDRLGLFSKIGAEGSLIVSDEHGYTVAVKILDGSARALHGIALEAFTQTDVLRAEDISAVLDLLPLKVFGGDEVVGEIKTIF